MKSYQHRACHSLLQHSQSKLSQFHIKLCKGSGKCSDMVGLHRANGCLPGCKGGSCSCMEVEHTLKVANNSAWKHVTWWLRRSRKVWMWKVIFLQVNIWERKPMSVLCGVTNQPQRQVSLTVKKQSPREYCSLLTLHQYSNLYQDSANIRARAPSWLHDNNISIREEHIHAKSLFGECLLLNSSTPPVYM